MVDVNNENEYGQLKILGFNPSDKTITGSDSKKAPTLPFYYISIHRVPREMLSYNLPEIKK